MAINEDIKAKMQQFINSRYDLSGFTEEQAAPLLVMANATKAIMTYLLYCNTNTLEA